MADLLGFSTELVEIGTLMLRIYQKIGNQQAHRRMALFVKYMRARKLDIRLFECVLSNLATLIGFGKEFTDIEGTLLLLSEISLEVGFIGLDKVLEQEVKVVESDASGDELAEIQEVNALLEKPLEIDVTPVGLAGLLVNSEEDLEADIRLAALEDLFNMLQQDNPIRFQLIEYIVIYAKKNGSLLGIVPQLEPLEKWMKEWEIPNDKARSLLVLIADSLKEVDQDNLALGFSLRALAYAAPEDGRATASVIEDLLSLSQRSRHHVQLPEVLVSRAELLKGDKTYGDHGALLRVFVSGDLDDYIEFCGEHAALTASLGLKDAPVYDNMLGCVLGRKSLEVSEYSLQDLQDDLGIDLDKLTELLYVCNRAKLFGARIDEEAGLVRFLAAPAKMDAGQWDKLGRLLGEVAATFEAGEATMLRGGT